MRPQNLHQDVALAPPRRRDGKLARRAAATGAVLFALIAGQAEGAGPSSVGAWPARVGPVRPSSAAVPLPPVRPRAPSSDDAALPPLPPRRPPDVDDKKVVFGPDLPQPTVGPVALPHRSAATSAIAAPPVAVPAASLPPLPADIAAAELVCARLFSSGKTVARAISPVSAPNGCGIVAPIELVAVVTASKQKIEFRPPVTINCPLGEAVADWVRDDLVPLFDRSGKSLQALSSTSGYSCRGRNQIVGAKLSEHGKGNAIDIGGFLPATGAVIGVKDPNATAILADIKGTACARFMTVLGPGSDGYHESHMHVDLEPRRSGRRLCQWDLPGQGDLTGAAHPAATR